MGFWLAGMVFLAGVAWCTWRWLRKIAWMSWAGREVHRRRGYDLRSFNRHAPYTPIMRWHQAELEARSPDWDAIRPKLLSTYLTDDETGRAGGDW